MSDGRQPGPLGWAHRWSGPSPRGGISPTAAFSLPPPLGLDSSLPAMVDGEGSDVTIIPGEVDHRPGTLDDPSPQLAPSP